MNRRTKKILELSQQQTNNPKQSNLFLPNYETTKGLCSEEQLVAIQAFNSDMPENQNHENGNKKICILQNVKLNSSFNHRLSKNSSVNDETNQKNTSNDTILGKEFLIHKFLESTRIDDYVTDEKQEKYNSNVELGKEHTIIDFDLEYQKNNENKLKNVNSTLVMSPGDDIPNIESKKRISNETSTDDSLENMYRKVNAENDIHINAAPKTHGKRIRNKTHVCYYCDKNIIHMARHFETVHFKEAEVAKCLSYPKKSNQRKEGFAEIIKIGDFYHNCNVLATKTGELILVRRPTPNELRFVKDSDYGPCPKCLGFMLKKHIWHHMKYSCNDKFFDKENQKSRHVIAESSALISDIFGLGFSKEYHKSVVSAFRSDEIGNVCKNDVLILKFGAMQYEKYADTQAEFIRQTMRQLARLTLALNKLNKNSSKSLADFLAPDKYDLVIQATKEISMNTVSSDSITRPEFHTPSLALKIGYALKKCIAIERGSALRAGNMKKNKTLLAFKELLEMEWNIRISSNALSTLYRRKFNATQLLPVTGDLVKLSRYIDSNIAKTKLDVDGDNRDNQKWTRLATLCLARIILFNKRRSGEASKMKMSDYISRPYWEEQNTAEIRESLSPVERKLAESMIIVEVEGKRGRKVPIILPTLIKESIDILIRHRDECKISFHNKYIFARSNESKRFLRGHDCLKKICEEIHLENPDAITGTKLRKYVATVCQLFNMSENEYDWLARHLGHDITVHREFYRMHESAIELTKISRILLAVDQGEAHKYVGKHINEINIEDLPALEDDTNIENENVDEEKESDCDEVEAFPANESESNVDSLKKKRNKKQPKETKSIHVPWTCEEKKAVMKFFQVNIKKGIVPGKLDCERCIKEYAELANRDWKKIKFCVKNEIQKIRKSRK